MAEFVLMEYTGDSPALQRTPYLPSGNRHEYSAMPSHKTIAADPMDVDALKALDFKQVQPDKAEVQRLAEADKEAEQAREVQAEQQQAVASADQPSQRRK